MVPLGGPFEAPRVLTGRGPHSGSPLKPFLCRELVNPLVADLVAQDNDKGNNILRSK